MCVGIVGWGEAGLGVGVVAAGGGGCAGGVGLRVESACVAVGADGLTNLIMLGWVSWED